MKARRLLTLLAAMLITAAQALILAADTASVARTAAPQQAYAALHRATWRRV